MQRYIYKKALHASGCDNSIPNPTLHLQHVHHNELTALHLVQTKGTIIHKLCFFRRNVRVLWYWWMFEVVDESTNDGGDGDDNQ